MNQKNRDGTANDMNITELEGPAIGASFIRMVASRPRRTTRGQAYHVPDGAAPALPPQRSR